jgi:hypothetical protein
VIIKTPGRNAGGSFFLRRIFVLPVGFVYCIRQRTMVQWPYTNKKLEDPPMLENKNLHGFSLVKTTELPELAGKR